MTRRVLMIGAIATVAAGCAVPHNHDHSHDDPDDDGTGTLVEEVAASGLFTVVDRGTGAPALEGRLVLADIDAGCDDLDDRADLDLSEIGLRVDWARATLHRGAEYASWEDDYRSQAWWKHFDGVYDSGVSHFSGEVGRGAILAGETIGVGDVGYYDLLTIRRASDDEVAGVIDTPNGDIRFRATRCPDLFWTAGDE